MADNQTQNIDKFDLYYKEKASQYNVTPQVGAFDQIMDKISMTSAPVDKISKGKQFSNFVKANIKSIGIVSSAVITSSVVYILATKSPKENIQQITPKTEQNTPTPHFNTQPTLTPYESKDTAYLFKPETVTPQLQEENIEKSDIKNTTTQKIEPHNSTPAKKTTFTEVNGDRIDTTNVVDTPIEKVKPQETPKPTTAVKTKPDKNKDDPFSTFIDKHKNDSKDTVNLFNE